MNEHMRQQGRHRQPSSQPRTSGLRPSRVIAAATVTTATTAAAAHAPALTPAEATAWHKVVSTEAGRKKVFQVTMAGSSERAMAWASTGPGHPMRPAR